MNIIDPYIFHLFIFSPLAAAIFITLIPTFDLASKLAISKFFSVFGLLCFLRLFFLFLRHDIPIETGLSFGIANFHVSFFLLLNKYNVFLYGGASVILVMTIATYVINDTKSNIHQVSPFLLTFFLFICFGQSDLRVALPLLSMANFLIFYLIASTDKSRRGSTIFQMGIFLVSCDALALVVLQLPYAENATQTTQTILNIVLLAPGFARLCIPLFAPYTKRLLLNMDETEGPFLISFLQFSGILILIFVRQDIVIISDYLSVIIAISTLMGAILVALLAITDRRITVLPYYFLIFYSSLGCAFLFINTSDELWYLFISLILTNLACFFHTSRCAILEKNHQQLEQPQLKSIWFFCLALLIGLPGFGIGTPLWGIFYWFIRLNSSANPLRGFFFVISLLFIAGLILLSFALVISVRDEAPRRARHDMATISQLPIVRSMAVATVFLVVISWIIPLTALYAARS